MSSLTQALLAAGDNLRDVGNYQGALAKYDQAITLDPNDGYIYALIAFTYKKMELYQEAVDNYETALDLGQEVAWIYHDLGFLLTFKIPRRDDALVYYDRAIELDSSNLGAILLDRGNCLIAMRRFEEAEEDFLEAIANNSQYAETYAYAGGFCEEAGQKEQAMKYYDVGLDLDPNHLNTLLLKADLLTDMGKIDEALQFYQHIQSLYPNEALLNYRMGSIYTTIRLDEEAIKCYQAGAKAIATSSAANCAKAQCLVMLGRDQEALITFRKAKDILDAQVEITLPLFLKIVEAILDTVFGSEESYEYAKVEASTKLLITAGDNLRQAGKYQQAIVKYDQALAFDPTDGYVYALKAFTCKQLEKYQLAVDNYKKALDLGQVSSWIYHDLGFLLTFKIAKREEALIYFNRAIELDSSNLGALLLDRGNCLIALGRTKDAKQDFMTAIQHNSQYAETYSYVGGFNEEEGKRDEAMKYYDMGLAKNPNDLNCCLLKASLLADIGKTKESLVMYQHLLSLYPNEAVVNYRMGCVYASLGQPEEAKKRYETGARANTTSISAHCAKGQCLSMLGRHEEAMEMYHKAQKKLLEPNGLEITLPTFLGKVKIALKAVLETEEASKKVQAETSKYDKNNPAVQKFITNIKALQEKKILAQNKVLDQVNAKDSSNSNKELAHLDQIKEEYMKELAALKKELNDFKKEVRTDIKTLKNNMDDMKEELNSKMDDYNKKLDIELNKRDLSDDDKKKIKGYFTAFVGTLSSAHVAAQVVDSGLVQLDTDSSAATVLSFMASFAPVVGSALRSGIKSIGEFLKSREMKSNARILKGLAPDAVTLSQIIGKAGFTIVLDKKKQPEILGMTDQDLNRLTGHTFLQIFEFCRDANEKIDVYLYTQLYKSAPERLGHNDANKLIDLWVKGKILPFGIEEQFADLTLKGRKEETTEEPKTNNNMGCIDSLQARGCNMF